MAETLLSNPPENGRRLLALVLAIVAIAPLPLGSNRPLPIAIWGLCLCVLVISWAWLWALNRISIHHTADLQWAILGYSAICLWILIQWVPWMPAKFVDPIWPSASSLIDADFDGRLSVNPAATITGLMRMLVYASVFWLTFQLSNTSERAWMAIRTIAVMGSAYALYGIIIYISGNDWIVIYPKWAYLDSLTSTFVNRNSYATFAGLTLLCAVAVMLRHLAPFFSLNHPLRSKIVLLVEEVLSKAAWKTFSIISIAIALVLSASRGGVASTSIGLLSLIAVYLLKRKFEWRQFSFTLVTIVVTAIVIFSASGNHLSKRLPTTQVESSLDIRNKIYAATWEAILTSPWKGTGFGTFDDVIPAYKDGNDSALIQWDKAHNTYLENALELGLPATFILNLSILLVAFRCLLGVITRKRDKLAPALGVSATILVGLHSLVDFSLQIPAIAILYAAIMGIAVSQSWSKRRL